MDEEKLGITLLQYHNTLFRKGGLSPTQKLYGHPVQDMIPVHEGNLLLTGSEAWKSLVGRNHKRGHYEVVTCYGMPLASHPSGLQCGSPELKNTLVDHTQDSYIYKPLSSVSY